MILHCNGGESMLIENEYGTIEITNDAIADIVASRCYGVHGMANPSKLFGLVQLLKRDSNRKGIKIEVTEDNVVNAELHIVVRHGVNIAAAGDSLISEVRYNVEEMTGMKVGKVDVFVDSLMTD